MIWYIGKEKWDICLYFHVVRLEISLQNIHIYHFVAVTAVNTLCTSAYTLKGMTSQLSIASSDIRSSLCSEAIRHLEVHATPGQQINVTMVDFMWGSSSADRGCVSYGDIVDQQTGRRVMLCGGQQRESTVLLSISSTVRLNLQPLGTKSRFLITFQGQHYMHFSKNCKTSLYYLTTWEGLDARVA